MSTLPSPLVLVARSCGNESYGDPFKYVSRQWQGKSPIATKIISEGRGAQRFLKVRYDICYLRDGADKWAVKHVISAVIAALAVITRDIWRDAMEFWCTGYEEYSRYMDTTGHND